jgi:adenine phosphoribosyltransferase
MDTAALAGLIADVPDFPEPGVVFKDITPLLASPPAFAAAVGALVSGAPPHVDLVVGMEARGFIFAAPVALALGAGFAPVRKPGKLPRKVVATSYRLEYGTETLAIHADAVRPGDRVLIVDDVLATGGTGRATVDLISQLGGTVVAATVLVELAYLHGRELLRRAGVDIVTSVLTVERS